MSVVESDTTPLSILAEALLWYANSLVDNPRLQALYLEFAQVYQQSADEMYAFSIDDASFAEPECEPWQRLRQSNITRLYLIKAFEAFQKIWVDVDPLYVCVVSSEIDKLKSLIIDEKLT